MVGTIQIRRFDFMPLTSAQSPVAQLKTLGSSRLRTTFNSVTPYVVMTGITKRIVARLNAPLNFSVRCPSIRFLTIRLVAPRLRTIQSTYLLEKLINARMDYLRLRWQ